MKEETKNERSILAPFLVGGIIGAGIALLLAPKTGKEMRAQIKDVAADAKDTIATTLDKGKEVYDVGRVAITNAVQAGKVAFVEERDRHLKAA